MSTCRWWIAVMIAIYLLRSTSGATTTAAPTTTGAATTTTGAATTTTAVPTTTGPGGSTPPPPTTAVPTTPAPTTAAPFYLRNPKRRLKHPYTWTFTRSKVKNHTRTLNLTVSSTAASRSHSASDRRTLTLSNTPSANTFTANVSVSSSHTHQLSVEVTESRSVSLGVTHTRSQRITETISPSSTASLPETRTMQVTVSDSTTTSVSVSSTTSDAPPDVEIVGPDTVNEDSLTQTILLNLDDGSERTLADSTNQRNIFFQLDNDHWNTLMDLKGIYKLGRGATSGPTESPNAPADSSSAVRQFFYSRISVRAPGSDEGSAAVNAALPTLITADSVVVGNRSFVIFFNVMPSFVLPASVTDPIPVEITFGKYLFSRGVAPFTYQYFYISPSVRRVRSLTLTTSSHVDVVTALCIVVSAASLIVSPVASGALVMEAPLAAGLQPLATCSGLTDSFATLAAPFPRFSYGTELTGPVAGCVIVSLAWMWILLSFYSVTIYFVCSLKRMTPGEAFRYVRAPGVVVMLFCLIPAATRCGFAVLWASFLLPSARHNSTATALATVLLLSWTLVTCCLGYLVLGCFGAERSTKRTDPFAVFAEDSSPSPRKDGRAPDPFDLSPRRSRYARRTPKSKQSSLMSTLIKDAWRGFRGLFVENVDVYLDAFKLDDAAPLASHKRSLQQQFIDGWDDFLHYCYVERFGSYFTSYRYAWRFALFVVDLPLVVIVSAMEGAAVASPSACMNVMGWLVAILLWARALFLILIRPHNMPIVSLMIGAIDAWRALAVFVGALGWVADAKAPREASGVMLVTGQYFLLAAQLLYFAWFMLPSLHRPTEQTHEINPRRNLIVPTLIGGVKSADAANRFKPPSPVFVEKKPPAVIPRSEILARPASPNGEGSPLDRNLIAPDPLDSVLLNDRASPVQQPGLGFLAAAPSWEGLTDASVGGRRVPPAKAFKAYAPSPPQRSAVIDDPLL